MPPLLQAALFVVLEPLELLSNLSFAALADCLAATLAASFVSDAFNCVHSQELNLDEFPLSPSERLLCEPPPLMVLSPPKMGKASACNMIPASKFALSFAVFFCGPEPEELLVLFALSSLPVLPEELLVLLTLTSLPALPGAPVLDDAPVPALFVLAPAELEVPVDEPLVPVDELLTVLDKASQFPRPLIASTRSLWVP